MLFPDQRPPYDMAAAECMTECELHPVSTLSALFVGAGKLANMRLCLGPGSTAAGGHG